MQLPLPRPLPRQPPPRQANYSAMQACLAALVADTPRGSAVLELYAGAGVIGLALAAAGAASRVVCVEVNPGAADAFAATQARLAASKPVRDTDLRCLLHHCCCGLCCRVCARFMLP